jgi:GNAT superfamily N-acetyltransferase
LPDHGPSKATVRHIDYTEKDVITDAHKAGFSKGVKLRDIASAVGAPDDARVDISPEGGGSLRVSVRGTGYTAQRRITKGVDGKPVIENETFYVEPSHQGKGLGAQVFGRQVEQASNLGVGKIRTHAAGSHLDPDHNGYTTWPKFGYDAEIGFGTAARIKHGTVPKPPGDPKRVSDLMKTPEGRKWWTDHGSGQDMTFDLTPGSYSRNQWDAYRRAKASK